MAANGRRCVGFELAAMQAFLAAKGGATKCPEGTSRLQKQASRSYRSGRLDNH